VIPDRRNLAMLVIAVCSVALLPTMMPANDPLDPLAPMAPLPAVNFSSGEPASMLVLHQQAEAALKALRSAATQPSQLRQRDQRAAHGTTRNRPHRI
jgi:hypothetical protein